MTAGWVLNLLGELYAIAVGILMLLKVFDPKPAAVDNTTPVTPVDVTPAPIVVDVSSNSTAPANSTATPAPANSTSAESSAAPTL